MSLKRFEKSFNNFKNQFAASLRLPMQVDSTGSKGASTQALGILDIVWGPGDAGHAWWKARNFSPEHRRQNGMIVGQ